MPDGDGRVLVYTLVGYASMKGIRLSSAALERVRSDVPNEVHGMVLVGINERFRCYRYKPTMRFAAHKDSAFHRDDYEQSWYSFLV